MVQGLEPAAIKLDVYENHDLFWKQQGFQSQTSAMMECKFTIYYLSQRSTGNTSTTGLDNIEFCVTKSVISANYAVVNFKMGRRTVWASLRE